MSDFNQVILIGRLGKDPEIITPKSGKPFAKVQIATNKRWKKDNATHERVHWHTVIFNNGHCALAENHLHKGEKLFIRGELRTQQWIDKNGNKRSSVFVHAQELRFLSAKQMQKTVAEEESSAEPVYAEPTDDVEEVEDIPF
jgi:single-strand DNA-binding protein